MPGVNQRLAGGLLGHVFRINIHGKGSNPFILSTVRIMHIMHHKQLHYLVYQEDEIC